MNTRLRVLTSIGAASLLVAVTSASVHAHEERAVGDLTFVVGFIDEPVFTGQKSGLEFSVARADEPVEGLEGTLEAEVIFGDETRSLPLSPRFGEPGWYQSVFFPTAAGPYTFRIFGDVEGEPVDESFTSSEEGFDEVGEATSGQFPIVLPAGGELAADAEAGANAAGQATLALILGGAGLLAGLVALGLALARRRA
jgi:hypothetical protein